MLVTRILYLDYVNETKTEKSTLNNVYLETNFLLIIGINNRYLVTFKEHE